MKVMASNENNRGKINAVASFDGVLSVEDIAGVDADTLFAMFTYKQQVIDKKSDVIEKKSEVIEQLKKRIQVL